MNLQNQNILFIVRTMGLGGTENVVLQLCEILSDKVNKIVVCSSGGVHEKKLQKMGIKHYMIPDIASKNPMDMLKSCRSIKNVVFLFDYIVGSVTFVVYPYFSFSHNKMLRIASSSF